jgi:transketolase
MADSLNPKSMPDRVATVKAAARQIRTAIVEMIFAAQSGHPGGSLSAADLVAALYFDQMRIDPANPDWPDRDRFVLSKGHACPVWYAALALRGFFPVAELLTLRQLGSKLQGHPVRGKCPGVDATTGSLGVGFGQAVGFALDARLTGRTYRSYAILGDGELQEGIVWEAANTAAKHGLDNLIAIVDQNGLQNDGFCRDIMAVGDPEEKFRAFGWQTIRINGHRVEEILPALDQARACTGRPYCIIAETIKGKGASFMENVRAWHGKPPSAEQCVQATREIQEAP